MNFFTVSAQKSKRVVALAESSQEGLGEILDHTWLAVAFVEENKQYIVCPNKISVWQLYNL